MASIAVSPLFLQEVSFNVDSDDFSAALSSVAFNPTTPSTSFTGMSAGASFTFAGNPTWQCAITFAQDWSTAGSLSNYLMTNAGQTKTVTFVPNTNDPMSPTITASINIAPGAIGGGVNTVGTATVTLGVQGSPSVTPATTP